jgi:hypothetical protein
MSSCTNKEAQNANDKNPTIQTNFRSNYSGSIADFPLSSVIESDQTSAKYD